MPDLFGDILPENAYSAHIPVVGIFSLTARCNLHCGACRGRFAPAEEITEARELSAGEWLRLAAQARQAGLAHLLLCGGEVFLRPDFFEIYEGLLELELACSVDTNATAITREIARRLATKPPRLITVELFGASCETYLAACGVADAFDQALRGICLLQECGVNPLLRATLTRHNRQDLGTLLAMAEAFGTTLCVEFPCGGADTLPPGEVLACEELVLSRQAGKSHPPGAADLLCQGQEVIRAWHGMRHPGAFFCMAGHCAFAVRHDGAITPCALLSEPVIPYDANRTFAGCWEELTLRSAQVPGCIECAMCPHRAACLSCPARLLAESGSFLHKAPALCERAMPREQERR